MPNIMEQIEELKAEKTKCLERAAEIDRQLREIAGALPRRRKAKDKVVITGKTSRKAKTTSVPANPVPPAEV